MWPSLRSRGSRLDEVQRVISAVEVSALSSILFFDIVIFHMHLTCGKYTPIISISSVYGPGEKRRNW